jgi:hypothetical protein
VIRDLSKTLEKVIKDTAQAIPFPELKEANVVFDRPTDPFKPSNTKDAVDLFLYDVRENTELRSNEPVIERIDGQAITHPPPLRLSCSYLVTAWPLEGLDLALQEHRLLSQVLRVLSRYPTIPPNFLQGSLAGQEPTLPMVALNTDALKNISEFWTSIGNKLKPSLTVTVTISVPVFTDVTDFLVTTETISTLAVTSTPGGKPDVPEVVLSVGGRVLDPAGKGIAGAQVDLLEAGRRTVTEKEGRFRLLRVPTGTQTLRAAATGFETETKPVTVPGLPADYEITLQPL